MKNVQLVLGGDNVGGTDISLCWSAEEGVHYLFLGLALIQRLPGNHEHVLHKLAVAQLVNAGARLRTLAHEFHHAPRVMKRWGEAVQAGDIDGIAIAFSGQGPEKKVTPDIAEFVRGQYLALRDVCSDFRRRIVGAVLKRYGKTVSGESLRQIFRLVDLESGAPAKPASPSAGAEEGADCPAVSEPSLSPPPPVSAPDADADKFPCASPAECVPPRLPAAVEPPADGPGDGCPDALGHRPIDTNSCVPEPVPGTDSPMPRNLSCAPPSAPTVPARPGLPVGGFDPRGEAFMVHHAGQILFSPFLDVLAVGGGDDWPMHKQWLAQILQGAVNIEQSKTLCAASLSLLCGDCGAARDAQRRSLKRQAVDPDAALALHGAGARLVLDGPGSGHTFYYDVHSEGYTGAETILKGWAGSQRGIRKTLHMDFIHTRHGDPCFAFHSDNYYDLRERVFMVLDRFNQLCPGPVRRGRTWIIDRGIFRLDIFDAFRLCGDYLLTWELGYKRDGWDDSKPAVLFRRCRERNEPGTTRCWEFACQESPWPKDPSVRRIVVRVTTPNGVESEVAVLCTNPSMPLEEAVTLIFNRWIQENDFWYLDTYMGIGQLTSYASESYADIADTLRDRPMDCPEYRDMKKRRALQERRLGKLLLEKTRRGERIERKEEELQGVEQRLGEILAELPPLFAETPDGHLRDPGMDRIKRLGERMREDRAERTTLRRSLSALRRARARSEEAIRPLKSENDELRREMDQALRTDSRLRLLIDHNYRRLDTRAKAVMDALRITARNMFRRLLETFRPIYRNYRDDHVILRELTRAPGILRRSAASGIIEIELRPKATYTQSVRGRVEQFLKLMTTHINEHFEGRAAPIRIILAENAASPVV